MVFAPCYGEGFCFFVAEVVGEFLRYAFGGEESAVGVEGDHHLLFWVWGRHVCGVITLELLVVFNGNVFRWKRLR